MSRVRTRRVGGLGGLPLFGGVECRRHAQCPGFAPSSSEVAVGFFSVFLYLVAHNLPQLHMHEVIFSPLECLRILLLEEIFVQLSSLQQKFSSPRSQLVSKSLFSRTRHWNRWSLRAQDRRPLCQKALHPHHVPGP